MSKSVSLGAVLAHLEQVGADLATDKALVDLKGVFPTGDHHQTAVFLRLPYPGAYAHGKVKDRITKFLSSINRPDTIKADVYTVLGKNVMKGYQPTINWPVLDGEKQVGGTFNMDDVVALGPNYCLQITVDVVLPEVLAHAMGMTPDQMAEALAHQAESTQSLINSILTGKSEGDLEVLLNDLDDEDFEL